MHLHAPAPGAFATHDVSRVAGQRTYPDNGATVTEVDATDADGQTYDEAEVTRYLNQWAEQMGQSLLVNRSGTRRTHRRPSRAGRCAHGRAPSVQGRTRT